jgi:hypothetical protein
VVPDLCAHVVDRVVGPDLGDHGLWWVDGQDPVGCELDADRLAGGGTDRLDHAGAAEHHWELEGVAGTERITVRSSKVHRCGRGEGSVRTRRSGRRRPSDAGVPPARREARPRLTCPVCRLLDCRRADGGKQAGQAQDEVVQPELGAHERHQSLSAVWGVNGISFVTWRVVGV